MLTLLRPALAATLLASRLLSPLPDQGTNRNVLLLIADDLGVEQVQCYGESGYTYPATDNIDRLAAAGVLFRNAWSNPVCSPMRASTYTGRHVFRHGIAQPVPIGASLADGETTIPEVISGTGYVSGLFGKWHLGADAGYANAYAAPLEQGWSTHIGTYDGRVESYREWPRYEDGTFVETSTDYVTAAAVSDAADWITAQQAAGRSWFATVAFTAPHEPYHWPPVGTYDPTLQLLARATGETELYQFKAMVESLDHYIGQLLDDIGDGALRNTVVVFVGDNGTDGAVARAPYERMRSKGSVFEGGVNVPLIVADGYTLATGRRSRSGAPTGAVMSPGREVAALIHVVDLFPTINEIAGALWHPGDGVSLIGYLDHPAQTPLRSTVFTQSATSMAIRDDTYKLIVNNGTGEPALGAVDAGATFSLYNLTTDPFEQNDLLDCANPGAFLLAKKAELLAKLEDLLAS